VAHMTSDLVVTVIPNWNLKQDLAECLDSLAASTYPQHLVVVVDNGSTDGSQAFLKENYPWVHLISLVENLGYAAALNEGIAYARQMGAGYVFALNNDTIVQSDVLSRLVSVLASDRTIGILAPKVLIHGSRPPMMLSLGERRCRWLPVPVRVGARWIDRPDLNGLMEFDYVTGCAMLIPEHIFTEVGLFDPTYFMYYEDADFCRRVQQNGFRIVRDASVIVLHKHGLSSSKDKPFATRARARSRVRFYKRYRHGPHPWLTYATLLLAGLGRTASFALRGQASLVGPYWKGLWEGWQYGRSTGDHAAAT
jgi:GT2 family glycosyltransferase